LQCCLGIFLVAGVWSKTSGENSLNGKYSTVLSEHESNLWTKSTELHKWAAFGTAALQTPAADVPKDKILVPQPRRQTHDLHVPPDSLKQNKNGGTI